MKTGNSSAKNYTPELMLALKNAAGRERIRSMTVELARTAAVLTKKDIGHWRQAWQMALNPESPNRQRLYGVYTDAEIDLHLTGCISQRMGMTLHKSFKMVDKNSKEQPEVTELFEAEWFGDFVRLALESRYWGHSLIQFGDVVSTGDKKRFDNVELVPRVHVVPEFGVITKDAGDDPKKGFSFREGKIANWCIEAGRPNDLGLLLRLSPPVISKKNMAAFWDGFGELFGIPLRTATTTSRDAKEVTRIEKMLANMGAAAWGLFPEGTTIDVKETTKGDAYSVFDRRIERVNTEISKGILNQTMTIDNGSSLSQSQVHLEVFENVVKSDAQMIRNLVNTRLIPFMAAKGFPVEGLRFDWDNTISYTPEESLKVEEMLLAGGYEIDVQYFIDKYNIPVTGRRDALPEELRDLNPFT